MSHQGQGKASWLLVARVVAAGSALAFLGVVGFVSYVEFMFRESRCPFRALGTRVVEVDVVVREEARRCLPDTEEHRWILIHPGKPERILGVRRLHHGAFDRHRYRWRVTRGERGLGLTVENDGIEPARFHEEQPKRPTR